MNSLFLLATTEASHSHSFMDGLPHLAGMLMVMVTLTILWGVCALTAKLISVLQPESKPPVTAPAKAATTPAPAAPVSNDSSSIAPEIIAVIAAAVATVSGNKPVRIVSIKPMSTSWERAGRQSVLTSHRIR
jgi:sodium pump decarboxylase gamma subunit